MSKRLNLELRILIEKHLGSGWSLRAIGSSLGVSASTVSREVRRNGGAADYAADAAQRRARRMRGGVGPPRVGAAAWRAARRRLRQRWSPEQAAAAADAGRAISAATIRRRIRADAAQGGTLAKCLRRRGKPRRTAAWRLAQRCKSIPARIHYSQRPAGARDRSQAGHWEIDTLMDRGTRHTAGALLLVERRSRQVRLAPLPQLNAATVCRETIRLLRRQCVRSITADNGGEFAGHQCITAALRAPAFFTDPGRPGQRGTCENAAALVRDLTRGQPLGSQSPRRLAAVAARINRRPMKTHAWRPRNQAAKRV